MKKVKGFTLIELIVVIAIIGVLCAILVPSMMGWVTKSRVGTANSNAKSIYNSTAAVITEWESSDQEVKAGPYNSDQKTDKFVKAIAEMEDSSSKSHKWAVIIDKDCYVRGAIYSANGKNYTGAYPNSVPEKKKISYNASLVTKATSNNSASVWK